MTDTSPSRAAPSAQATSQTSAGTSAGTLAGTSADSSASTAASTPAARRPAPVDFEAGPRGAPLVDYDVMSPRCPSRSVLRHVLDRWAPLVVIALHDGPLRFSELRSHVGGVTPKVLTQTLRSMERDGLLERTEAGGVPPRVDYELTPLGASLRGPMTTLRAWAQDHASQVMAAREAYDAAAQTL